MRENRTYGSEGGEPAMDNSPTPISSPQNGCAILGAPQTTASSTNKQVRSTMPPTRKRHQLRTTN
jgi:hypothetical protein